MITTTITTTATSTSAVTATSVSPSGGAARSGAAVRTVAVRAVAVQSGTGTLDAARPAIGSARIGCPTSLAAGMATAATTTRGEPATPDAR